MLDVATLAATVVSSVLLPYIKDGAAKLAETVTEKAGKGMGEYAADMAGKVWDKVKSAFSSPSEKVVLDEFENKPEAASGLVEAKLKEKLEQDVALAQEIEKLVNAKAPGGQSTGAQIIGSSYVGLLDMRGANVSGSQNTFTGGAFTFGGTEAGGTAPPPRGGAPQPTSKGDKSGGES
jgi:hypothetical protein